MSVFLILGGVLAVLLVLVAGIGQFAFGKHDPHRSNRFMRYRVIAQATMLAILLAAIALSAGG